MLVTHHRPSNNIRLGTYLRPLLHTRKRNRQLTYLYLCRVFKFRLHSLFTFAHTAITKRGEILKNLETTIFYSAFYYEYTLLCMLLCMYIL